MTFNPKERSEMDQHLAKFAEFIPSMHWQLYQKFQEEGFNEEQAFTLTRDHLKAFAGKPWTPKREDD